MNDAAHLARLQAYWKRHRFFPALQRLCDVVGLSSTSSVHALVNRLCESGHLLKLDGRPVPGARFFERQVIDRGMAGHLVVEGPGVVSIDDFLVDEPDCTCLYVVEGDALTDLGIEDGDLAVVQLGLKPDFGDAVLVDKHGTLLVRVLVLDEESGEACFQAGHPAHGSLYPHEVSSFVGTVVGIARRLRAPAA